MALIGRTAGTLGRREFERPQPSRAVRLPRHTPAPPSTRSIPIVVDPVESARLAGLKYVRDTVPGIRRKRRGHGFSYVAPDGRVIRDPAILDRIRRLAIPPCSTRSGPARVVMS